MSVQQIFRYEVPVDGKWHTIKLHGDPLAVDCRRDFSTVEFWAVHNDDPADFGVERKFTVVGTGHPLPSNVGRYWGTAITPGGALVWHLLERNHEQ